MDRVSDEAVTVWAVDLVRDPRTDTKGTLTVGERAIEFRAPGGVELTIPFANVRKVRRVRGSPVLMVIHASAAARERTAFYFVQPPPLERVSAEPTRVSLMPGMAKRRARRQNASYLGMGNRTRRELVATWEKKVRAAMADAGR